MNTHKITSGLFFTLAMTLNFGFFYGDPTHLVEHSVYELFAAIVVNLIATVLKLGDKTQLGAVLLSTSLVADIQLIASATIWTFAESGLKPQQLLYHSQVEHFLPISFLLSYL